MWTRSNLKEKAKAGVKRNYWKSVLVSLVSAFAVSTVGLAGHFSNTFGSAHADASPSSIAQNTLNLPADAAQSAEIVSQVPPVLWLMLGVFAVLVIAFAVFAAFALVNPFNVGVYKYSLNAVRGQGNVSDLGNGFDVSYKRNVKVMFFYDLYAFLWTLLFIIPGVIKVYEYRMIPYILADHPEMDKAELFELSKTMMKGNKWRAFVLDLSFILWDLLSSLTLGFVGAFWVAPYKLLTNAALYDELKQSK